MTDDIEIPNNMDSAVLMGILKAIFMLTTGGDPDRTFDLWVHFCQNLQLNIGIIAACASFLRPLVGRFLKLNTSAANYYHSGSNRKGGTRPTAGTIGSSRYAQGRRGKGALTIEEQVGTDEFEMHTKDGDHGSSRAGSSEGQEPSDGGTQPPPLRLNGSEDGLYTYGVTSDSRSEDLIIQKPETGRGIMMTRLVRVQYSDAR
ncbi:hypothetical protein NLU13_1043 [Sarocladium strictum]|uniref:Uncharacterized protein n=1 Tax=Sarocladium strictum TaxID=5046 RepID=A0AA39GRP2_SARSR|nr:hypothetical protein NLU13_1043 [Sarocladium strictum]